jgi:CDP-diacylglycerol--glycerol-3-phosphate 3-phosphatidyltransferase
VLILLYRPLLPYNLSYNLLAGVIFVIAALTDKVDGYYARKYDTVTKLGQFLDPLADKLLMLPVMTALWYMELLSLWVLILVFVREVIVSVIRVIGAGRGISFPATWSGKAKMFSQVIAVGVLIIFPASNSDIVVNVIVYLMAAMTLYSGIDYVIRARREIFSRA